MENEVKKDVFEEEIEDIEKGIRTVIVPRSSRRAGYQYQRNFPENKKENHFAEKANGDKEVRKVTQKLIEIKSKLSESERESIENDKKECSMMFVKGDKSVKLHKSRYPDYQKNAEEKRKSDIELTVAEIFAEKGFDIYMPYEDHAKQNQKNPDFIINDVRFELKSITGNLNNIQQRYRQALKQSSCVILSFKNKKEVPDFMRKQAALNGARLTNELQNCLIFLFEDEKQIEFYDTSKIIKKGSPYTGEPLMVNEKTTERSEFRIKNDSRSDNGAITPTTNISQINKMSKLKLDYDGKNMLHKSFDIKISDITESNREKKIEQTEKALNAIYNNQPFVIRHIKAEKGEGVLKNLVLRISDFDKNKIEKAVHSMQFTLDTKIKAGSGEAFLYKSQEELTDLFVEELTEKTKAIYSFVIAYFGLPEIRVLSKSDLKYKGKVVYDPETGKPISKAEWNKFVKTLEDFLNRNYKGIGKRIVLSAKTLGRMLERLSKSKSLSELKIYIFYVHEVFTEDDLKKRGYHAHIESKFAATYRKASA